MQKIDDWNLLETLDMSILRTIQIICQIQMVK